ncbi:MAG: hypothetical protein E6R03_05200, partial [Hyphomicrobiaceae bacterium]
MANTVSDWKYVTKSSSGNDELKNKLKDLGIDTDNLRRPTTTTQQQTTTTTPSRSTTTSSSSGSSSSRRTTSAPFQTTTQPNLPANWNVVVMPQVQGPAQSPYQTPNTRTTRYRTGGTIEQGPETKDVYMYEPSTPALRESSKPKSAFEAAINQWRGAPADRREPYDRATAWKSDSWRDFPADMDAGSAYDNQIRAGRPVADVKEEVVRRAQKRAEALGGRGEGTPLAAYMTEGERKFYNTEPFSMGQQGWENLKAIWRYEGDKIVEDWSDFGRDRGNYFNPFNDEWRDAKDKLEYVRENNAAVYQRAMELRAKDWQDQQIRYTMTGIEPSAPRPDLVPLEPFVELAAAQLGYGIISDAPSPTAVLARNIWENYMEDPTAGSVFNVLGNTLGTAINVVEGAGKSVWSAPIEYDPATNTPGVAYLQGVPRVRVNEDGTYEWVKPDPAETDIVAAGEYASAAMHAMGKMATEVATVPPWQYGPEENPIYRYQESERDYINRITENLYRVGPVAGGTWNPDDDGQQMLLEARAGINTILSFSGVESQEAALATVLGKDAMLAEMEEELRQLNAQAADITLDRDIRANASYNAAQLQLEIKQLRESDLTDTMDANFNPLRDALLGAVTDVTLWNDVLGWFGLGKRVTPAARRLNAVEDMMDASDVAIIRNLEQIESPGVVQDANRIIRPGWSNVEKEMKDARALFAYTFQGVTVKADVATITKALVENPQLFFTKGIPVEEILSPALKGMVENGYVKFPNIQGQLSPNLLKTLKAIEGEIGDMATLAGNGVVNIGDAIDELLTTVRIYSAGKYGVNQLPFEVPVGATKAKPATYAHNVTGDPVHVVELLDGNDNVLHRKVVPTKEVAEAATKQVEKILGGASPVKMDPLSTFTQYQRTYASLVYLAVVPGSWVTNAVSANLNIIASGVGNLAPLDEIYNVAGRVYGTAPYEYLQRGSVNDHFMPKAEGWLKKLRNIRSGSTVVPGTNGRISFGENANKSRAWFGGWNRAMTTFVDGLRRNELDPLLETAGFDASFNSGLKAALNKLARNGDITAFTTEWNGLVQGNAATFNPARYGDTFGTVLRDSTVAKINTAIQNGGGMKEIERLINEEISFIRNSVGTDVTATSVTSVTGETLDSVKQVNSLAAAAAKAGDEAVSQAAQETAKLFERSRSRLRASFELAVASGNTELTGYITEAWDAIALSKRDAYAELNALANDIRASGVKSRWGAEYRQKKLAVWAQHAANEINIIDGILDKIAKGQPPMPRRQSAIDAMIASAPDLAPPKAVKGTKLENLIETYRLYRQYYQQEFFKAAAETNDIRALDIFLSTSEDIGRYEATLWAEVQKYQDVIDSAKTNKEKAQAIGSYKAFVVPEHHKFTVWAAAKWRAATEYLNVLNDPNLSPVTFNAGAMGEVSIVAKTHDGGYVIKDTKGAVRTVSPKQVPKSALEKMNKRAKYLQEMAKGMEKRSLSKSTAEVGEISLPIVDTAEDLARTTGDTSEAPANLKFTTAKGSVYEVASDGTTTRNKAARSDHPGDFGPKERSTRTVYVTAEDARKLGMGLASGQYPYIDDANGTLSLVSYNRESGRMGAAPSTRGIKFQMDPDIGLHPYEVWEPRVENGTPVFGKAHLGSEIIQIGDRPTKYPGVDPETPLQRAEPGPIVPSGNATVTPTWDSPLKIPSGERFYVERGQWYWQVDERADPVPVTAEFAQTRAGVELPQSEPPKLVSTELLSRVGTRKKGPFMLDNGNQIAKEGETWWIKTSASTKWQKSTEQEVALLEMNSLAAFDETAATRNMPTGDSYVDQFLRGEIKVEELLEKTKTPEAKQIEARERRAARKKTLEEVVPDAMMDAIGTRKKGPMTLSNGNQIAKEGDKWWIKTEASEQWQESSMREARLLIANALPNVGPLPPLMWEVENLGTLPGGITLIDEFSSSPEFQDFDLRQGGSAAPNRLMRDVENSVAGFVPATAIGPDFTKMVEYQAFDLLEELKRAQQLTVDVPSVANANNDTIALLEQLKKKVQEDPTKIRT